MDLAHRKKARSWPDRYRALSWLHCLGVRAATISMSGPCQKRSRLGRRTSSAAREVQIDAALEACARRIFGSVAFIVRAAAAAAIRTASRAIVMVQAITATT